MSHHKKTDRVNRALHFVVAALILFPVATLEFTGCSKANAPEPAVTKSEPKPEPAAAPAPEPAKTEAPAEPAKKSPDPVQAKANDPDAGRIVWAPGKEGKLMLGLDGGDYEPYLPSVVVEVQKTLQSEGIYSGEITGILDKPTMEALGEFQKQHDLAVSGVPTPRTREVISRIAAGKMVKPT